MSTIFPTVTCPAAMTSLLSLLLSSSSVFVIFSSATFCPVRSPFDQLVYVTDPPSKVEVSVTLTKCALGCRMTDAGECRFFNFNETSSECSLFYFDPTNWNIDPTQKTTTYQVRMRIFREIVLLSG